MSRSRLLTHWTGKDICTEASKLSDSDRHGYAERLKDILVHGLWMTEPGETLTSSVQGQDTQITITRPMTCFTELRLSSAHPHFVRYGLLGIVVDRLFVLERLGAPVHYVRQHHAEALVGNLAQLQQWIGGLRGLCVDALQMLDGTFLGASFLKGMSNPGTDDFAFLEEHEWRIVQTDAVVLRGAIVATGFSKPRYRIPLAVGDVRLVIVPDEVVRSWITGSAWFRDWTAECYVPIHTVADLKHF